MKKDTFTCHICKKTKPVNHDGAVGYGEDSHGHKICYVCCGIMDRKLMNARGKATLYFVKRDDGYYITNWPGTLAFKVNNWRKGSHNIAGVRYDVWFYDENNQLWHGVQYGDWTQLCHCKRSNQQKKAS